MASEFTPLIEKSKARDDENAVMRDAGRVWAGEMIDAIENGYVVENESPTARLSAIVVAGGKRYVASLVYSIKPERN